MVAIVFFCFFQGFSEFSLLIFLDLNQEIMQLWVTLLAKQAKEILKGPKHEKFVTGILTQIKPVWMGELETRQKTSKN
jgi:hypothetical protein